MHRRCVIVKPDRPILLTVAGWRFPRLVRAVLCAYPLKAPAMKQTIQIDPLRSVRVAVEGKEVFLSLLVAGVNTSTQKIDPPISQAIGAALVRAGMIAEGDRV